MTDPTPQDEGAQAAFTAALKDTEPRITAFISLKLEELRTLSPADAADLVLRCELMTRTNLVREFQANGIPVDLNRLRMRRGLASRKN
jgi:hypothetical protein